MTTEELSVITTGSTEIDRRLGGGIPYNTVMLIAGQDASGKSTFANKSNIGKQMKTHEIIGQALEHIWKS